MMKQALPSCEETPLPEKPFYSGYWADKNKFRWTFDELALMAPTGWRKILEDLTAKLFYLGWDGGVLQVKEKFGSLRFYSGLEYPSQMAADIAQDVISEAEYRSASVCQTCGKYGKTRGDGWLATLCKACAIKEEYPLFDWEKDAQAEAAEASSV